MQSLNHLVASGKVLYLGISDTPAWVVSAANQYAKDNGLAQFVVYQGKWSVLLRDLELDIIPMCKAYNMAIAPWGALGGGQFKTEEQRTESIEKKEGRSEIFNGPPTDISKALVAVMDKFAKKKNTSISGIALSYVLQKTTYVFPIVGIRKIEHLKDNINALENVVLSNEEIKELEDTNPLPKIFPHSFIGGPNKLDNFILSLAGKYSFVEESKPILLKKQ